MKPWVVTPIVVLFFVVSTFGSFVVGYCPPPRCDMPFEMEECATFECSISEPQSNLCGDLKNPTGCDCGLRDDPEACGASTCEPSEAVASPCGEASIAQGCGQSTDSAPACSSGLPARPRRVPPRFFLPISLAFDPITIPCCAQLCITHTLSDFREAPESNPPSPDLMTAGGGVIVLAERDHGSSEYRSLPSGVHPIVSTTILRL